MQMAWGASRFAAPGRRAWRAPQGRARERPAAEPTAQPGHRGRRLIGAPISTKNADEARDTEMHQRRKGQPWYFGMKTSIGADTRSAMMHSAVVTAANDYDKRPPGELRHGQAVVGLRQGSSSRTGEERDPRVCDLGHGQMSHALDLCADRPVGQLAHRIAG